MVHRIAPAVPRNCPCAAILQSTVPRENFDESGSRSVGYWRKKCAERSRWTSADTTPRRGSLHPIAEAGASSFDLLKRSALSHRPDNRNRLFCVNYGLPRLQLVLIESHSCLNGTRKRQGARSFLVGMKRASSGLLTSSRNIFCLVCCAKTKASLIRSCAYTGRLNPSVSRWRSKLSSGRKSRLPSICLSAMNVRAFLPTRLRRQTSFRRSSSEPGTCFWGCCENRTALLRSCLAKGASP